MKLERARWFDALLAGLAVLAGLWAGRIDFRNDEPQAAAIWILLFTVALGLAGPRRAWLWALLVTAGLPAAYVLGRALGYTPVSWPQPGLYATLLAFIPALLGAYAGALTRRLIAAPR